MEKCQSRHKDMTFRISSRRGKFTLLRDVCGNPAKNGGTPLGIEGDIAEGYEELGKESRGLA